MSAVAAGPPAGGAPSVAGRWAVVLGASAGSGAAIATALADDPGLHLYGVHRGKHPDLARGVADAVAARGRTAHLAAFDASSPEGAARGAAELLDLAGPASVHIFVHSIASGSIGRFFAHHAGERPIHPRQIQKTFDAMAHSFVYWAQALDTHRLLAPGARLLGLTNPCGESLLHNIGPISAAKAALEIYVRHLALELGPRGLRVNLLKFGAVETAALRQVMGESWDRLQAAHAAMIPAGRMCTVDEVGRFVSVLAGEAAAWFNGATIDFTGGQAQSLYDAMMRRPLQPDGNPP